MTAAAVLLCRPGPGRLGGFPGRPGVPLRESGPEDWFVGAVAGMPGGESAAGGE